MQFQVYKHGGCQNHNIDDEIIDENFIVSWNQVFKYPKWKPMIDTWFRRFKVNINLNIFFIMLIWLVY
jgi:myosin-crossreactive antigen